MPIIYYNRAYGTRTTLKGKKMLDDFTTQIQSDEANEPTAADWQDYNEWLDRLERKESIRRLMDAMDGLQQDEGHCLDFGLCK